MAAYDNSFAALDSAARISRTSSEGENDAGSTGQAGECGSSVPAVNASVKSLAGLKAVQSQASGAQSSQAAAPSLDSGQTRQIPGPHSSKLKNPIVWMDLEMTGLDPERDEILEIAVLITDSELTEPHLEGPDLIIHQSDEVLTSMNDWSKKQHEKSGLTQKCRESSITLAEAEEQVLTFLQRHTESMQEPGASENRAHLAGNSVYVDRAFLQRYMPRVHKHLHWRLIDISTLLELARRWYPTEFKHAPRKRVLHTAMADIRESLKELRYYRKTIFKQPSITYAQHEAAQKQAALQARRQSISKPRPYQPK